MPCSDQAAGGPCAARQCSGISSKEDTPITSSSCQCQCQCYSGCVSYPAQRRRRRNRFTCYRRQTLPLPLQWPLLLLLLVAVTISMLPLITCTEHSAEAEAITQVTTSKTLIDSESPANNSIAAKTTHDEDNEIFTVVDEVIVKEVKTPPEFVSSKFEYPETSLTESLEETIRNSVKNQIEIEQNIGSSSGQLLKDISEVEERQKLTEELLSIEYPQKGAKLVSAVNVTGVEELGGANYTELPTPEAAILQFSALKVDAQAQKLDQLPGIDENIKDEVSTLEQSQEAEAGSQRGARNLDSVVLSGINSLPSVDDAENVAFQSIEEEKSAEQVAAASPHSASSSSSSSSSESSSDSKPSKEAENDDLVVDTNVDIESSENSIDNSDIAKNEDNIATKGKVPSDLPALVKLPQSVASSTAERVDALSIVFNENLTAIEPTAQLEDDQLESLIHLEETLNEPYVTEATTTPDVDKTVHVVIKKQGVDLNEGLVDAGPLEVLERLGETTTTTVQSVVDAVSEEDERVTQFGETLNGHRTEEETTQQPQLQTEYAIAETTPNEMEDQRDHAEQLEQLERVSTTEQEMEEQTTSFQYEDLASESPVILQPDEQPVNQQTEVPSEPQTEANSTADAVVQETTTAPASDSTTQNEFEAYEDDGADYSNADIAPAVMGGADVTASTKGSRSINTQTHQSVEDSAAATLFESFPPHVAGQTFNDNLAAESAGGMGKVLPARSVGEVFYLSRSSVIIAACAGMALLFLVVSIVCFLVSFQRQHGTLDIEMQEQRCGKDNLDDDDDEADTCTKLLEIELPPSTVTIVTAEETDECL